MAADALQVLEACIRAVAVGDFERRLKDLEAARQQAQVARFNFGKIRPN